jgi:hypothetical protein
MHPKRPTWVEEDPIPNAVFLRAPEDSSCFYKRDSQREVYAVLGIHQFLAGHHGTTIQLVGLSPIAQVFANWLITDAVSLPTIRAVLLKHRFVCQVHNWLKITSGKSSVLVFPTTSAQHNANPAISLNPLKRGRTLMFRSDFQ